MFKALLLSMFVALVATACHSVTSFELEQDGSAVIPDFDNVTRVEVDEITGNQTFEPFAADRGGGRAEDLRIIDGDGNVLARLEDARIFSELVFVRDGITYEISVHDFHIGTFTEDTVTLHFYGRRE